MSRLRVGVVRYASVATAIGRALGIDPAPEIRIGQGRITVTLRSLGASRWPEAQQMDYALRAGLSRGPFSPAIPGAWCVSAL